MPELTVKLKSGDTVHCDEIESGRGNDNRVALIEGEYGIIRVVDKDEIAEVMEYSGDGFSHKIEDSERFRATIRDRKSLSGVSDSCPECHYDRVVVSHQKVPGVAVAKCNNPECGRTKEL